jgi:UTP--glucose-1-phosphate uridylyltransferase
MKTIDNRSPGMSPIDISVEKMRGMNVEEPIIDLFTGYYKELLRGTDGFIHENALKTVADHNLVGYEDLSGFEAFGRSKMPEVVKLVLNGGLGTTMGLAEAKSLLTVKHGQSFMDIILEEVRRSNARLCLMNSRTTHNATCRHIAAVKPDHHPLMFFQHQFPKIVQNSLAPASWPKNKAMEWNPSGHGDVYNSLHLSGMLDKLLNKRIRYAFICNSDNLGATLDPALLGYFARMGLPFMMEVTRRRRSDAKGGHLAMDHHGTLVLRESAQCAPEDRDTFQDIKRHRYFNTNNIWIHLPYLKRLVERDGFIRLPMMLNSKHLDPRDEKSPKVYQIETAMGAAISQFKGAEAVRVPRRRFFPVKSTNDLLVLRSDRFILDPEKGLTLSPDIDGTDIRVDLDRRYYKRLDMFEERFREGLPSLASCRSLTVRGNVFFGAGVQIRGDVTISFPEHDARFIPRGTRIDPSPH